MFGNYVVAAVADAAERNRNERIRLTNIRDNSNPFELRDTKFKKLFRLPKTAAQNLIERLQDPRLGEGTIPKHIKILATLNFFSHGSYQAVVGEDSLLGLSQPSTSRCINITADSIVREMAQESIKFPSTPEEKRRAKRDFLEFYGMPGVLGAIDASHIAIFKPPINNVQAPGSLFYNRKGFYSVNVQMVVNANGRIISINPNFPGSTHDAAIWTMSHLRMTLETDYVNGASKQWLLGDKGYPLQPWLVTPIASPQTSAEENFNRAHCSARNVVEMCFGRLKNKLRCLHRHRTLHYDPPTAAKIIIACSVIYNTFTDVLSDSDDSDSDQGEEEDLVIGDPSTDNDNNYLTAARRIRDTIVRDYF